MCLTTTGETFPESDLCGTFGTCIQNTCVCKDNFVNSLDFLPAISGGSGAKKLLQNLTSNGEEVTLDKFYAQLIKIAPCTRHKPLIFGIFVLALFVIIPCIVFSFYSEKRKRFKVVHYVRTFSLSAFAVHAFLRVVFIDDAEYPFHFPSSLSVGFFVAGLNATFYFYFYQFTKYHLSKAKLLYGLKVTFYGFDLENIFFYQIRISIILDLFVYAGSYFAPPIFIQILCSRDSFTESDLNLIAIFQKLQHILGATFCLYLLFITRVLFPPLVADLKVLSDSRDMENQGSMRIELDQDLEVDADSKNYKIRTLIEKTLLTTKILTVWTISAATTFIILLFVPQIEVSFQYTGPILTSIIYPITIVCYI
eukprot:snap_masked-scaffold_3-processed-gene-20.29-mRNA-1 protein AED:1.00 eAED:1.00 QI:0/0/0/0/1/1/2/0/365